jgi:hypothetical protein
MGSTVNLTSIFGRMNSYAPWGNVVLKDEDSNFVSSPHRSSSGMTSEIQRKGGRKARKEHYTRKAVLENQKEAERRRVWLQLHPDASESNWRRREERRKTRRATRHVYRKRKTSSKRH